VIRTTPAVFREAQDAVMADRPEQLRLNLAATLPAGSRCFVGVHGGFAITPDAELVNLFAERGHGDELVAAAVELGAKHLNCFDGYLPVLYARHGFVAKVRVPFDDRYAPAGWTYGRPGVLYMERV